MSVRTPHSVSVAVQLVAGDSIELEFESTNDSGQTFHHFHYYLVHERSAFIFGFTDDPGGASIPLSTFTAIAETFRFLS